MKYRRFFSPESFWNQPIPDSATPDPRSDYWIRMLECEQADGIYINLHNWTIPVYSVDQGTPLRTIHRSFERTPVSAYEQDHMSHFLDRSRHRLQPGHPFGHGPGFGPRVPIPDDTQPDRQGDAHLAVVDWESGQAWDMWALTRTSNSEWESCSGMTYSICGTGVFSLNPQPEDNESIHLYGPSRAPGVPAIAGLIMQHEIEAGSIEHKLAFATGMSAFKEIAEPTIWCDGCVPGGIPQGAVLQLDPSLDLDSLNLSRGGKIVARALQKYGMVNVDHSTGTTLYGEGLWSRPGSDWSGWLEEEDLGGLSRASLRVIAMPSTTKKGYDASHRQQRHVFRNERLVKLLAENETFLRRES